MTTFHYPADLAARTEVAWPEDLPPDPHAAHRTRLLEVAYQASMVRDEERPVRLRILLARPDELAATGTNALHVLRLDRARPCDADELRRLAAATPYETSVVCVAPDEDLDLRIWGVAWTGAQWLAPTWGGRLVPRIELPRTVVHVGGPGRLAVHAGDRLLASLERGNIATLATDVFGSRWLGAMFADARAELVSHDDAHATSLTEPVLRKVTSHMLRRALWLVRASRHGGTLLFAESTDVEALLSGPLRAKYRFAAGEPRLRYRSLLGRLAEDVARAKADLTPERALGDAGRRLQDVEAGIFEVSRLVASLTQVDGAALLSKRFEIVAFGVEVLGGPTSPTRVRRAIDAEGLEAVDDPEESVGTRHRAAYRFVHTHPRGLAVVVSQDGTVRFVAQVNGAVTYFEQYIAG